MVAAEATRLAAEAAPFGVVTWHQIYFVVGTAWAAAVPIVGGIVYTINRINAAQYSSNVSRQMMKDEIQKDIRETRHGFYGRTETMQLRLEQKIEDETRQLEGRIREVELQVARIEGANAIASIIQAARSEAVISRMARKEPPPRG